MLITDRADVIFINGRVITVDDRDYIAEAIAVKGKKILKVGLNDSILALAQSETEVIDLKGRTLMPGFIDAHMHFTMYSLFHNQTMDIAYDKVQSIQGILEMIKEKAKTIKPGEWICLWGYDHNKLDEKRHPSIEELDAAAPNNPVQCVRCCGHMGVYSSKALAIAGINHPDQFAPGEVVVDASGKLTGLLKETPNDVLWSYIKHSDDALAQGYEAFGRQMLRYGITSLHDAGTYGGQYLKVIQDVIDQGRFPIRFYAILYNVLGKEASEQWIDHYIDTGVRTGTGNEHFKIGAAKILLDGSTSGPSCAVSKPYEHDPDLKGILNWTQDEVNAIFEKAHLAGYQLTAHAVGDLAVNQAIEAIEHALSVSPKADHRARIEHCALIDDSILKKLKELNIIPISNPGFITINGGDYKRFYGERTEMMFSNKSYIETGIVSAFGSDASVMSENPMLGLYGAVNRKDIAKNLICGGNQSISVLEAIRSYTYNGAYAAFEEGIKGSIEEGKLADLIVLNTDILETPKEAIKDIVVDLTMIDGQILYKRNDASIPGIS